MFPNNKIVNITFFTVYETACPQGIRQGAINVEN